MASLALAAAGCAAGVDDGDQPPGCEVIVSYSPDPLIASLTQSIRASARVIGDFQGVATYRWKIERGSTALPLTPASPDLSQMDFLASDPGIYAARVEVTGCDAYEEDVNVLAPGASPRSFRLRVTPPASSAIPTQDRELIIPSGADFSYGALTVDSLMQRFALVRSGDTAVPAYVRLFATGGSGAAVAEAAATESGELRVAVRNVAHEVLVVPTGDHAPFRASWLPAQANIVGPVGRQLSGTVRGPDNQAVAGARVTVKRDGVPSTVGISDANGAFTLRLQESAFSATVSVVPPPASGLPRLDGAVVALSLTQPLAISYRADLALREVGGVELRRQGAAAANAQAIFVGVVAAAGSVGGAGTGTLQGAVRVAVTAGGDGKLPAAKVPATALAAVIVTAPGEQAVLPFDGAAAPPAVLDAPAMRAVTGTAKTSSGAPAAGAVIDLLPSGDLARAGVSGRTVIAGADGAFSVPAASGGSYHLELSDPAQRGAPRITEVAAPGAIGAVSLGVGHRLEGKILPQFASSPLAGAAVEMFCVVCSAEAGRRPLATAITRFDGVFSLLVPDDVATLPQE